MIAALIALIPAVAWLDLVALRGSFWWMDIRDDHGWDDPPAPANWPPVVAVVPARNEADVIARSLGSLLAQDYPGEFRIVLVDDQSSDGTGAIARKLGGKLDVVTGSPRPPGWTGKVWAMKQGTTAAGTPDYLWYTDADIDHAKDNLRKLVSRAERDRLVLASLMAKLHCRSIVEAYLIPAFVYFFAMLFPFAWVNDPRKKTAAAAGGCMLARRDALERAGGIDTIKGEIIDDCALGRALKAQGPIWLGLTQRAFSIRPYGGLAEIRRMVARSAYAQLGYSPLALLGTILGMIVVFVAGPAFAIYGHDSAQSSGILAWVAMTISFQPIAKFYRVSPLWGVALPVIGILYTLFTLDSAVQHWRGRGGMWKGRAQALGPT